MPIYYVLKLEDQENSLREINERADGRLGLKNLKLNSNLVLSAESDRDLNSSAAQDRVAQVFRRDIEFFGYEF